MTAVLFKHLAIGDRFAFKEAREEDPASEVFIRRGRNKYSSLEGVPYYTGLCVEVVIVERAADRRYTLLEEMLLEALRGCVVEMEESVARRDSMNAALRKAKATVMQADLYFPMAPAPRPASPGSTPMHWNLPPRK